VSAVLSKQEVEGQPGHAKLLLLSNGER